MNVSLPPDLTISDFTRSACSEVAEPVIFVSSTTAASTGVVSTSEMASSEMTTVDSLLLTGSAPSSNLGRLASGPSLNRAASRFLSLLRAESHVKVADKMNHNFTLSGLPNSAFYTSVPERQQKSRLNPVDADRYAYLRL